MSVAIKLVVIDDHPAIVEALKSYFGKSKSFSVVKSYSDGSEVNRNIRQLQADIVICDLHLPGINGFSLCENIKRVKPSIKIVFYSSYHDPVAIQSVLASNANGYVSKDAPLEDLEATLLEVYHGKHQFHIKGVGTKNKGLKTFSNKESETSFTKLNLLTSRERQICELYAKGFNGKDVAQNLELSDQTVKTHRKNIFKKLEVRDMQGLMRFCFDSGLM